MHTDYPIGMLIVNLMKACRGDTSWNLNMITMENHRTKLCTWIIIKKYHRVFNFRKNQIQKEVHVSLVFFDIAMIHVGINLALSENVITSLQMEILYFLYFCISWSLFFFTNVHFRAFILHCLSHLNVFPKAISQKFKKKKSITITRREFNVNSKCSLFS